MSYSAFQVLETMLLQPEPQMDIGRHLAWSSVAILILLLAFGGLKLYRRWMNANESSSGGFTLSDLRKLHREGKMSTEEFEKAKAILIGNLKSALDKPGPDAGPRKSTVDQDPSNPEKS